MPQTAFKEEKSCATKQQQKKSLSVTVVAAGG